jgi:hypothetical protein
MAVQHQEFREGVGVQTRTMQASGSTAAVLSSRHV